jgi:hypothetical protein
MSNAVITKFIAVALTTAAISTVAATGNAFAREGGGYGGWHGGYGHGFGYGRYYGGYGYGDFYRGYGDYDRCYRFHHRYWGCEGY